MKTKQRKEINIYICHTKIDQVLGSSKLQITIFGFATTDYDLFSSKSPVLVNLIPCLKCRKLKIPGATPVYEKTFNLENTGKGKIVVEVS